MDRVVVSVPTAVTHNESHVEYRVDVRKGGTAWSVSRRYTDFEKLHAAVKRCVARVRTG
jgi:hypothetical protein